MPMVSKQMVQYCDSRNWPLLFILSELVFDQRIFFIKSFINLFFYRVAASF